MKRFFTLISLLAFTYISVAQDLNLGLVAYYKLDGDAVDAGPNGLNGTITNVTPVPNSLGQANKAMSFTNTVADGNPAPTSWITLPASPLLQLTGDKSFSFWIRPYTDVSPSGYSESIYSYGSCGDEISFNIYYPGIESSNGCGGGSSYISGVGYYAGSWQHVVITESVGGQMSQYRNGVLVATGPNTAISQGYNNIPYIGKYLNTIGTFLGYRGDLDQFRIYNRVLTQAEITLLSNENNPVAAISSFTPDNGYVGTSVIITGTGFTGATAVTFGGVNAASFTVTDDSHITAIVGADDAGVVSVVTAGGTSSSSSSFTNNGYVTANDGDWNTGSTWLGGNVPPKSATKTLNNAVTISSPVTDSGTIIANTYFNIYSTFTNNGVTTIAGSLQMGDGGVFVNNGTITYNNGTLGYYNTIARVTGDEFPAVNGPSFLSVSNLAGVTLNASRSVSYLSIQAGSFFLGNNNITVGLIQYSTPAHYVVTNGTGTLTIKGISSSPVLFPVGPTATSYNPITISNADGSDFSVSVQPTFTNALNDASKVVNAQWTISKTGSQTGNNVTLTPEWNAGEEASNFIRSNSLVLGHYGTSWNEISASAVSGPDANGLYSTTANGVSSFSVFGVGNTGAFAVSTFVTASNGDWSAGSTWVGGNVPPDGASVIINHTVTMDVSPTINSGDSMIINGALITGYNTVSGTGKVIVNGLVKTVNGAGFSGASNTSFTNTLSSVTLSPSSTVEYASVFATQITPDNYANLTSSGVGDRLLPSGTIGISGTFIPGTNNWSSVGGNTTNYNGSTSQNIAVIPYDNLSISNSGTKTLAGNIVVNGNLLIDNAATLDASTNNYSIAITGDWTNNGSFTNRAGLVTFNGTSNGQAIEGTSATTFSNLTINNSNGIGLGQNIEVTGILGLQGGEISTSNNKVFVSGAGTINGGNSSSYISGTLQRSVATGSSSVFFPIGETAGYVPVSLAFTGVTTAGDLTANVSSSPSKQPQIGTSTLDPNKSVNRYWTLTNNGISGGTYDATFEFLNSDVDAGADPNKFIVGQFNNGTWSYPTSVDFDLNDTKATGVSGFGDFQIGQLIATPPTISSINNQTICGNTATDPLSFVVGDAQTSAGNLVITASSNNTDLVPNSNIVFAGSGSNRTVTISPAMGQSGTDSITITVTDSLGLSASTSFVLTVNPSPNLSQISGQNTICVGQASALSDITPGFIWSSDNTAVATVDQSGNVTGISAGTANISYGTIGSIGCPASVSLPVTVTAPPIVSPISGTTSLYAGNSMPLSDATTGGTWSSDNISVASVNVNGLVTGNSQGTANISYTVTNINGCSASVSTSVTVNILPTLLPITGSSTVNIGSTTQLSDATPGGIWTSNSPSIVTVDANGIVTGIAVGFGYIQYTVTYEGGVSSSVIFGITVIKSFTPPTISSIPDQSTCYNSTSNAIPFTIDDAQTTSDNLIVAGSSDNTLLIPNSNIVFGGTGANRMVTITPSSGQSGTANITIMVTDGVGLSTSTSFALTVYPSSASTISGIRSICAGKTSALFVNPSAGIWSSDNAAVATVDANGVVTGVTSGTANIIYTVVDINGCTVIDTALVTINALPVVAPIAGNNSVCIGSVVTLTDATAGGAWSSGNTSVATVTSAGVVTIINSGTATVYYTVTNSSGCTASAGITFTPGTLTVASITGSSSVCKGSTISLADANSGGTWSSSNASVATVNSSGVVSGIAAGTANIIYTLSNNGCSAQASIAITVNAVPTVAAITGTTTLCAGKTVTLKDATTGGVWSSNNTALATVSTTGVVTGVSGGIDTIRYTVTNSSGCSTSSIAIVTINALPVVSPIVGSTSVCTGSVITFTDATTGGAWSSSNTAVATVGSAGVVSILKAGTATISYTVTNSSGCTASASLALTATTVTAAAITGTTTVCIGPTTTLKDATKGGIWSSSNTAIDTVSTTGVVTGIAAGVDTITYTVTNSSGCVATASAIVTVNSIPEVAPIVGNTSVCTGSTVTLTDATAGGVWSSSNTAVATVTSTGAVSILKAGTVIITYTVTNSSGCAISTSLTLTATTVAAAAITGATSVCTGKTTALKDATAGGVWSSSNRSIGTVSTTGVVTGVSAGSVIITYTVTNAAGCIASASDTVAVNATPVVGPVIAGSTSVCTGSLVTLTDTTAGGTWSSSATTVAMVSTEGVVTILKAGTAVITYTVTNASGCTSSSSITLTSTTVTAAAITGTTTVCAGSATTLKDATSGGIWSSSNTSVATVSATGVVTGISAGSAIITYTVVSGVCSASSSATVTVNAIPVVAAITGSNFVVVANTATLSDATPSGVWSSSKATIATVSTSGVVTGVAAGTCTISYTVTNASGCAVAVSQAITVYKTLAITLSATKILCNGSLTTLTASVTGGSGSYQYTLNHKPTQSGNTFSVGAGTDTVVVKDLIDTQSLSKTITITQPTALAWTLVSSTSATGGLSNGSITVKGSGGTAPLQYSIDGTTYQTSGSFTGLAAGAYTVYLKDANSCTTTITLTVSAAASAAVIVQTDSLKADLSSDNQQPVVEDIDAKVAPNPAITQFNLETRSNTKQTIEILVTDILGKPVYHTRGEATNSYHFGQSFAKGVYIIQILHSKGIKVLKVVKQ
jgi:uncharacterized protein YjdB